MHARPLSETVSSDVPAGLPSYTDYVESLAVLRHRPPCADEVANPGDVAAADPLREGAPLQEGFDVSGKGCPRNPSAVIRQAALTVLSFLLSPALRRIAAARRVLSRPFHGNPPLPSDAPSPPPHRYAIHITPAFLSSYLSGRVFAAVRRVLLSTVFFQTFVAAVQGGDAPSGVVLSDAQLVELLTSAYLFRARAHEVILHRGESADSGVFIQISGASHMAVSSGLRQRVQASDARQHTPPPNSINPAGSGEQSSNRAYNLELALLRYISDVIPFPTAVHAVRASAVISCPTASGEPCGLKPEFSQAGEIRSPEANPDSASPGGALFAEGTPGSPPSPPAEWVAIPLHSLLRLLDTLGGGAQGSCARRRFFSQLDLDTPAGSGRGLADPLLREITSDLRSTLRRAGGPHRHHYHHHTTPSATQTPPGGETGCVVPPLRLHPHPTAPLCPTCQSCLAEGEGERAPRAERAASCDPSAGGGGQARRPSAQQGKQMGASARHHNPCPLQERQAGGVLPPPVTSSAVDGGGDLLEGSTSSVSSVASSSAAPPATARCGGAATSTPGGFCTPPKRPSPAPLNRVASLLWHASPVLSALPFCTVKFFTARILGSPTGADNTTPAAGAGPGAAAASSSASGTPRRAQKLRRGGGGRQGGGPCTATSTPAATPPQAGLGVERDSRVAVSPLLGALQSSFGCLSASGSGIPPLPGAAEGLPRTTPPPPPPPAVGGDSAAASAGHPVGKSRGGGGVVQQQQRPSVSSVSVQAFYRGEVVQQARGKAEKVFFLIAGTLDISHASPQDGTPRGSVGAPPAGGTGGNPSPAPGVPTAFTERVSAAAGSHMSAINDAALHLTQEKARCKVEVASPFAVLLSVDAKAARECLRHIAALVSTCQSRWHASQHHGGGALHRGIGMGTLAGAHHSKRAASCDSLSDAGERDGSNPHHGEAGHAHAGGHGDFVVGCLKTGVRASKIRVMGLAQATPEFRAAIRRVLLEGFMLEDETQSCDATPQQPNEVCIAGQRYPLHGVSGFDDFIDSAVSRLTPRVVLFPEVICSMSKPCDRAIFTLSGTYEVNKSRYASPSVLGLALPKSRRTSTHHHYHPPPSSTTSGPSGDAGQNSPALPFSRSSSHNSSGPLPGTVADTSPTTPYPHLFSIGVSRQQRGGGQGIAGRLPQPSPQGSSSVGQKCPRWPHGATPGTPCVEVYELQIHTLKMIASEVAARGAEQQRQAQQREQPDVPGEPFPGGGCHVHRMLQRRADGGMAADPPRGIGRSAPLSALQPSASSQVLGSPKAVGSRPRSTTAVSAVLQPGDAAPLPAPPPPQAMFNPTSLPTPLGRASPILSAVSTAGSPTGGGDGRSPPQSGAAAALPALQRQQGRGGGLTGVRSRLPLREGGYAGGVAGVPSASATEAQAAGGGGGTEGRGGGVSGESVDALIARQLGEIRGADRRTLFSVSERRPLTSTSDTDCDTEGDSGLSAARLASLQRAQRISCVGPASSPTGCTPPASDVPRGHHQKLPAHSPSLGDLREASRSEGISEITAHSRRIDALRSQASGVSPVRMNVLAESAMQGLGGGVPQPVHRSESAGCGVGADAQVRSVLSAESSSAAQGCGDAAEQQCRAKPEKKKKKKSRKGSARRSAAGSPERRRRGGAEGVFTDGGDGGPGFPITFDDALESNLSEYYTDDTADETDDESSAGASDGGRSIASSISRGRGATKRWRKGHAHQQQQQPAGGAVSFVPAEGGVEGACSLPSVPLAPASRRCAGGSAASPTTGRSSRSGHCGIAAGVERS